MWIGRVAELWRHPVKSLGGERVADARLDAASDARRRGPRGPSVGGAGRRLGVGLRF